MAHEVFISYSSQDKPTADAVCAMLEAECIRCWIAPRDVAHGQDWGESIIQAINGSRVMVMVLTSSANASPQIVREVERAVNKGVPVIPLRIEDIKPAAALEYFLSTPHWLDAFNPPLERHLRYLAQVIHKILTGTTQKALTTAPAKPPPSPEVVKDALQTVPAPHSERENVVPSEFRRIVSKIQQVVSFFLLMFMLVILGFFGWALISSYLQYKNATQQDPVSPSKALVPKSQTNSTVNRPHPAINQSGKPFDLVIYQPNFDTNSFQPGQLAGEDGWVANGGISLNGARIVRSLSGQCLLFSGPDMELKNYGSEYSMNFVKPLDFNSSTPKLQHLRASADMQLNLDPLAVKSKYLYIWMGLSLPTGAVETELLMGRNGLLWSQTYSPNQNRDVTGSGSYPTNGFHNFSIDCDLINHRATYSLDKRPFCVAAINPNCEIAGSSLYFKMASTKPTTTTLLVSNLIITATSDSKVSPQSRNPQP